MNRAIFLDRDGVLNELVYHQEQEVIDSPFTVRQFKLLPGVAEAIKLIRQAGYLSVVVSNQPGIAKGQMTVAMFAQIKKKMKTELGQAEASVDGEYYCLHHPEAVVDELRGNCDCRKPAPGLLLKAAQDMNIDLGQSWLVGDNLSDIKAGKSAGCRTVLIGKMKCELCRLMEEQKATPDHISVNLLEAAKYIAVPELFTPTVPLETTKVISRKLEVGGNK
jgi:D,D-heptose 1,7-bisphosphate phosphatase